MAGFDRSTSALTTGASNGEFSLSTGVKLSFLAGELLILRLLKPAVTLHRSVRLRTLWRGNGGVIPAL